MSATDSTGIVLGEWRRACTSLDDACVDVFGRAAAPGIGMIAYTVQACVVGALRYTDEGRVAVFDGEETHPLDSVAVFEARLFDESRELRWVRDARAERSEGTAVLVGEGAESPSGEWSALALPFNSDVEPVLDKLDGQQLLWGTVLRATATHVVLYTARIGCLQLPAELLRSAVTRDARIVLRIREYVAADAVHGNAHVFEERLLGFDVAGDESTGGE